MANATPRNELEYLFELAPLGPHDLLSRCGEGASGNWWGGEDGLRVDEQGLVVLMDSDVYFEHFYTRRNLIQIAVSAGLSVLSGRALGRPSRLSPALVEHISRAWHRPARPLAGVLERASGAEGPTAEVDVGTGSGFAVVALGRHLASVPLRPWAEEASVMDPLYEEKAGTAGGGSGVNLRGQTLASSKDGSVVAVSLPDGGVSCFCNSSTEGRGVCLATVPPRVRGRTSASLSSGPGGGVAGLVLRGSWGDDMEILVLHFDALLSVYSFFAGEPRVTGVAVRGGQKNASLLCEQRLGRWHASTSAMCFHPATDSVAIVGPSGASRSSAALALTLFRITGGACGRSASTRSAGTSRVSPSLSLRTQHDPVDAPGGPRERHVAATASSRRSGDGEGARGTRSGPSVPSLSVLHCVALEAGSLVVPAPRDGLDRGPSGTVPALLPLVFPGLRAVSPPVQVQFNPSGDRLAVLDLGGGVSVVEISADTARASPRGRRCLSADGRSWMKGPGVTTQTPSLDAKETGGWAGSRAEAPRVVSVGWWSDKTVGALSSTGELAFLDAAAEGGGLSDGLRARDLSESTAFQGVRGGQEGLPYPRPPPLGPQCTMWFAGDGRRAAVCWPGSGGGGGRWGSGASGRAAPSSTTGGGGAGSVMGLLSLATAVEAVEGRIRRGLLGEALDLAVVCGVDAGGVRAALWRNAVECGSVTVEAVEEHLTAASDHRWVVHEALSAVGLSSSEEAASALLREGLRRCTVLLGDTHGTNLSASDRPEATAAGSQADGWDFSDYEDDEPEDLKEKAPQAEGAVAPHRKESHGNGEHGQLGSNDQSDVQRLRARLLALQGLVETYLITESAQGRGFDPARLRSFLSPQHLSTGLDATVESTGETEWEDSDYRRIFLQTTAMEFAVEGQASALEVLFERYPGEVLPVRLETLSSLPEVLDPTSYAHLLPCCGPPRTADDSTRAADCYPAATFFRMDGIVSGSIEAFGDGDGDGTSAGGNASRTGPRTASEEVPTAGSVAAAAKQADGKFLASWFSAQARDLDSRGGQLRHALSMCKLGIVRIGIEIDPPATGTSPLTDGWKISDENCEAMQWIEVRELLALFALLRHLVSLVYTGSVSPSISLSQWESMGLEDKLEAVLQNSSAETIATDVRAYYAGARIDPPPADTGGMDNAIVPLRLEDVLVRVLGRVIRSKPSAETMEACAAVATASRPEVPARDRPINAPEGLLTLFLDACYAWTETAPDRRALEAAWQMLECIPSRREDVDASLQDRADALEGHLYATEVLHGYGLAPPLHRYLERGGGAEGFGRDVPKYAAFARELVDQMCAVVMERAGLVSAGATTGGGKLGVRRLLRRGGAMSRAGGEGENGVVLNRASREGIVKLHEDVSRLQVHAFKDLGERWAIRRVLQAVVEAGQFDVAKALVESSTRSEETADPDDEEEAKRLLKQKMAEDVLLSAAAARFNAAPSFRADGEELEAARRWLDLMPWSSAELEQERRLHEAGSLAYDLGAAHLIPLQLRLRLEGVDSAADRGSPDGTASSSDGSGGTRSRASASGAMQVLQEVLESNPAAFAYRTGSAESGAFWTDDDGRRSVGVDILLGDGSEGHARTPPGTGLMRLTGLMGLNSSDADVDRVRALVARAAIDNGDYTAACEIISAAVLRRPPPQAAAGVGQAEYDETVEFAPELLEALDLVVRASTKEGRAGSSPTVICAQALSRCPPSQIGPLLDSWSRCEAAHFLSGSVGTTSSPGGPANGGNSYGNSTEGHSLDQNDRFDYAGGATDGVEPADATPAIELSHTGARVCGRPASSIVESLIAEGMEQSTAATVGQVLGSIQVAGHVPFEVDVGDVILPEVAGDQIQTLSPRRAAEGALRLLLIRAYGKPALPSVSGRAEKGPNLAAATDVSSATITGRGYIATPGRDDIRTVLNLLCLHLTKVELRSAASQFRSVSTGEFSADTNATGGKASTMAHSSGTEFGVGPVERAVGYALAATDGLAVLSMLRALLEDAEGSVKEMRASKGRYPAENAGQSAPDNEVTEPDESLVSALHKRGVSVNRARRACVATMNSSREAALAWCVEHAGDPAMDAPLPLRSRRHSGAPSLGRLHLNRPPPSERIDSASGTDGNDVRGDVGAGRDDERAKEIRREESAWAAQSVASSALDAYVRARLSAMRRVGGAGSSSDGDLISLGHAAEAWRSADTSSGASEPEIGELMSVLSSFRKRASLGAVEDRVRAILSSGVDLARFSEDEEYRQEELRRAASHADRGKQVLEIVALGREYPGTDVWDVAAVSATALLGPGYSKLRRKGLAPASAAARIDEELRTGDGGGFLAILLTEAPGGEGVVELARVVFVRDADGSDLHHMDLLLRTMTEAAAAATKAQGTREGDHGDVAGMVGAKSVAERRLSAHCGLVRRLLKAAPPGLDYKRLVGPDPLDDPLVDPNSTGMGVTASVSVDSVTRPTQHTSPGLVAARTRAMAELRSVMQLDHVAAVSKLAARIPGLTGSAVYLAAAQRVLCGETGELSPEALELLRGRDLDGGSGDDGSAHARSSASEEAEEAEAVSASVYHLLAPLLRKMTAEDLVEAVAIACSPVAAGDACSGSFSCRRNPWTSAASPPPSSSSSALSPFPDKMEPLRLTLRCRRRILAEGVALLTERRLSSVAAVVGNAAATNTAAIAEGEHLARLGDLLTALDAVSAAPSVRVALEAAWALTQRAHGAGGLEGIDVETEKAKGENAATHAGEKASAGALIEMAVRGSSVVAVEAACSSMRAALGLSRSVEGDSTGSGENAGLLDLTCVYAAATSSLLSRLTGRSQEERTLALNHLRAMCKAATAAASSAGADADQSSASGNVLSAAGVVWRVVGSALRRFSREEAVLDNALDQDDSVVAGAAAAVVYRARAEVLTLLKTICVREEDDGIDVGKSTDFVPHTCHVDASGGTAGVDAGAGDVDSHADSDDDDGWKHSGGSVRSGDVSGWGADSGRGSPPSRLSVPFLRVAELAMEAFSARVSPEDVGSWQTRSTLMETLISRATGASARHLITTNSVNEGVASVHPPLAVPAPPRSGNGGGSDGGRPEQASHRLKALADILAVWESQSRLEQANPAFTSAAAVPGGMPAAVGTTPTILECARRTRVEAAARALLDLAPEEAGSEEDVSDCDREAVVGAGDGEALTGFMRHWWSKLLEVAANTREWRFLTRTIITGPCFAFTTESFEEGLWAMLETSEAPALLLVKVGLASTHLSRHLVAANLVASELCKEDSFFAMDEEALHLALSSPCLPQLAKTSVYPFMATLALRCGSSPTAAPFESLTTSTPEFLMLAMACTGSHARAAALVCETSGIHPGLRSLDGGLDVLGRHLRQGLGWRLGGAAAVEHAGPEWFLPWLKRLRKTAWLTFEADVLD